MKTDDYFDKLDSPMQEISKELRKIVLAISPNIKEDIKWNVPTYSINKNICAIMAHKKHVNLQIFKGAHIKDVQKLEGIGKDKRHLKFSVIEDINQTEVDNFLKQATELD